MIFFLHVDKFTGPGYSVHDRPGAEMTAAILRRNAKPAHEGPPHRLGGADPEIRGYALHRIAGPLKPPPGGVESGGLDELQRRRPGFDRRSGME